MNFPLDNPLFQFFYWLMNTPGVGGVFVLLIVALSLLVYARTLFWIARGGQTDEPEIYAYPTPTLHPHS